MSSRTNKTSVDNIRKGINNKHEVWIDGHLKKYKGSISLLEP